MSKEHMHFELHKGDFEITSPLLQRWMELVQTKVQTLPKGEPVQQSGCRAGQQVFASLIESGERIVIGSQVTDDLRVLTSLMVSKQHIPGRVQLKISHYIPGRVKKPKRDPSETLMFLAYTPADSDSSLEMLANIAFEAIRQKGFNDDIKALFRAPQPD